MKVVIVPSWYEVGAGHQFGAFFREQALALKKQNIEVAVANAAFRGTKTTKGLKPEMIIEDDEGLLTYSYVMRSYGLYRMENIGATVYTRNLSKVLNRIWADGFHFDLIHAHSFFPAGVGAVRYGQFNQVPVVVTEHSSDLLSGALNRKRIALLQETVGKCDQLICVSEALKDGLIQFCGNRKPIKVIPNLVSNLFVFDPDHLPVLKPFVFVSVGNLHPLKRFDLTLKAFAQAYGGNLDYRLTLVGDGPLRSDLEKQAQDLGIGDQVCFTGRLSRIEVKKALAESHAFVLASDHETFGVAYIEALAMGLPVIATKNGGADTIVTKENGFLVQPGVLEGLSEAFKAMGTYYPFYERKLIAQNCQALYGESVVIENIYQSYLDVLKFSVNNRA